MRKKEIENWQDNSRKKKYVQVDLSLFSEKETDGCGLDKVTRKNWEITAPSLNQILSLRKWVIKVSNALFVVVPYHFTMH